MASNIIPFESKSLPAYMKSVNAAELNNDLTAHAGAGFPVISIKGKIFAIVRDGERETLMNPKDPESPATSIDVVMLKANKGTSKVYYAKGYSEGSEGVKPDCFSHMGDKPDPQAEKPQAKTCAACKHNVWGSRIGDNGNKGKSCSDSVRLAVSTPDQINDPYLLRVPPASIRALGEYGEFLKKKGVGYNMVVTKIAFDVEAPTPKLTFKPVGFVDDASFAQVKEQVASDVVQQIIGSVYVDLPPEPEQAPEAKAVETTKEVIARVAKPDKKVTDDEITAAVKAAAPAAKPTAKPSAAETEISVEGIDLDSLNFDD